MNRIPLAKTLLGAALALTLPTLAAAQTPAPAAQAGILRQVGALVSINGSTLVFKTDAGQQYAVSVSDRTRLQRITPGETSLKNALPMDLAELKAGDRIRVLGRIGEDGKSVEAASIIAIKAEELADKQKRELQEWQKGVGGIVKSIDPAAKLIVVTTNGSATSKEVSVHLADKADVKRYAADSINFSEAKPSKLADLKPGDQLRARGQRSEDGLKLEASAIVAGSFRNISGKVVSVDVASNTFVVNDIATKKPVTLALGPTSQLRIIPEHMAQFIAMTLKGQAPGAGGQAGWSGGQGAQGGGWQGQRNGGSMGPGSTNGARPGGTGATNAASAATQDASSAQPAHGGWAGQNAPGEHAGMGAQGGNHAGGPPNFTQMLGHLPAAKINDLKPGDVLMAVTTEGAADKVTAITVVGGVEPLLTASPKAGSLLTPWNLSTGGGEGGGAGAGAGE